MADWTSVGMRIALGRPETCWEEVSRKGEIQPCERVAVALGIDPHDREPYPVCRKHVLKDMVPLEAIVRFLLDREEARQALARGIVRLAAEGDDQ